MVFTGNDGFCGVVSFGAGAGVMLALSVFGDTTCGAASCGSDAGVGAIFTLSVGGGATGVESCGNGIGGSGGKGGSGNVSLGSLGNDTGIGGWGCAVGTNCSGIG